jgi:hypothetical protein
MDSYLKRISRSGKGSKSGKGYTSFDDLQKGISTNAYTFNKFVRNVMAESHAQYVELMGLTAKEFLFELLIFVERVEKARNERDKRAAK